MKAHNGYVIRVPSPDGNLFVVIEENAEGKPIRFEIHIGKAGSSVAAWACGLADVATMYLGTGGTIVDLITSLSNTSSAKIVYTGDRTPVRSGVEAFVVALHQYRREKLGKYTERPILKQFHKL